jgi:hypothetical protein
MCHSSFLTKARNAYYCSDSCRLKRKEQKLAQDKIYRDLHKEERSLLKKTWDSANKNAVVKYRSDYHRNKRRADPLFRLKSNLRSRLSHTLRGANKLSSVFVYVGCSVDELRKHLESQFEPGMTWDNYGEWHVDHKRPLISFSISEEDLQLAWNYTNLQPLWAKDNLKKSDNYIPMI